MALGVTYRVVDNWGAGFNAAVAITAPAGGLSGWTLVFEADFQITQIWNAEIVSHVGNRYEIRNAAWNGTVGADGKVEFGFLGGPTSDPVPDAFTVNGVAPAGSLPVLAVADAAVTEGNAGTRAISFVVTLSAASATPVSVGFATESGSATAGTDFAAQSGRVTFAAGETRKVVTVAVRGDTAIEPNETFNLRLSAPVGATLGDALAIGTIRDDDTPPGLSVGDVSLAEGQAGTTSAVFTLRLSKAWTQPVTLSYATRDGTARAGQDYAAATGSLTFAAGETTKTVSVAVTGDRTIEANETFDLVVSGVAGATVTDGVGRATIRDDDTPPALTVSDVALAEGDAGTSNAVFTVRLSKAWDQAVTVGFTTANGTALAGADYDALTGTLRFAPGETVKTVTVAVRGDALEEADETFFLLLRSPVNATIRDGAGLATVTDDDGGPAPGFLATSGNQIVDSAGDPVRITGVNWFGMESSTFAPHGLWARNWREMMDEMAEAGFNTIRLPFSLEALQPGKVANGIDFGLNPDLAGLTPLQILDRIVGYAGDIGLRIVLDNHRSAAGAGPNGNGLWVDGGYTEAQWINSWKLLAQRYAGNPTVIGADLANEPHNGVWGGGGPNDWTAAAERAGNAILSVNDDWLIFVEGTGSYAGRPYWWGGNLQGVEFDPVVLNVANRLVYSPHDYGNSIYPQPWFSDPAFPNNLPAIFDDMWGYIFREGIAPVMLGEFGSRLADPKDGPWLQKLLAYLQGDFDANGTRDLAAGLEGISWTWWSWNPNSGDTGGILADDWRTIIEPKMDLLRPLLSDPWA